MLVTFALVAREVEPVGLAVGTLANTFFVLALAGASLGTLAAVFLTATDFTADLAAVVLLASFFVVDLAVGFCAVAFTGLAGAFAGLATVLADLAALVAVRVLLEALALLAVVFFVLAVAALFFAGFFVTVAFIVLSLKNCPTLFIGRCVVNKNYARHLVAALSPCVRTSLYQTLLQTMNKNIFW
jgi:hypothetical protein